MKNKIALKKGYRTPFVKINTHFLKYKNAVEISCALVDGMLEKIDFPRRLIQHVIWGMVIPDPDIYSIGREVVLGTKLDNRTEAYSISRACATSLQAATNAAMYYHVYPEEKSVFLVGGAESFSSIRPVLTRQAAQYFKSLGQRGTVLEKIRRLLSIPITRILPVPPSAKEYSTGLTMGEHCELMIKEFKVERERQDRLALASHQNAVKAKEFVKPYIIPLAGIESDTIVRSDSSLASLAKLKPAFDSKNGTITAGNASPLTDGAASLFVLSPAVESEVKPDGYLIDSEYVGFDPADGLLMGPGKAMLRLLKRHQLKWSDLDYIEIHEAFAGQVLCNVDAVNSADYRKNKYEIDYDGGRLDESKINPWGSSVSYGHPFAATGARMITQCLTYLEHHNKKTGLVAACTAGALAGACLISRS